MIIDFEVNCNNYKEKILNKYSFFDYVCPICGAKHSFTRHAVYERNISLLIENKVLNKKIKVLRLKCTSCASTHAILPNDVIPYCIYSYSLIIQILLEHFVNDNSVLSISNTYSISFQIIYSFISRLKIFLNDCIYILRILNLLKDFFNPSIKDILIAINNNSILNIFPKIYFSKTKWMFLMKKFLNIYPREIAIGSYNT